MTAPMPDPNSPEITPAPDPNLNLNTETQPSSELSVDTTGKELFFQTLREKNAEIARLKAEAESRNNRTAPKTSEQNWGEFTDNPRDLIRSEVAEAVRPLNDFIARLQTNDAFSGLKQQARSISPQFARVLDKAESYVNQALSNSNPTIENVVAAINLVAGMIAMNQIKGLSANDLLDTPTPKPVPTPRVVPPTLAPSSSPLSKPTDKEGAKPWENLTETELAMARIYKMTPQQYYEGTQGDVIEVDTTKGGGKK